MQFKFGTNEKDHHVYASNGRCDGTAKTNFRVLNSKIITFEAERGGERQPNKT